MLKFRSPFYLRKFARAIDSAVVEYANLFPRSSLLSLYRLSCCPGREQRNCNGPHCKLTLEGSLSLIAIPLHSIEGGRTGNVSAFSFCPPSATLCIYKDASSRLRRSIHPLLHVRPIFFFSSPLLCRADLFYWPFRFGFGVRAVFVRCFQFGFATGRSVDPPIFVVCLFLVIFAFACSSPTRL